MRARVAASLIRRAHTPDAAAMIKTARVTPMSRYAARVLMRVRKRAAVPSTRARKHDECACRPRRAYVITPFIDDFNI